ncbi:MAG: hypothetical protein JW797_20160 [Bradymonadales bacterium]|nr:hypothetical protein [Bradymonadales bacterium]
MPIRCFSRVIPILCLLATSRASAQDYWEESATFRIGRGGASYERGTISADDFQVMIYRRLQQVVTEMIHDDVRGTLATTSAAVRIVLEDSLVGIRSLRGRQLVDRLVADNIILDLTATEAAAFAQELFCDGSMPRDEADVASGLNALRLMATAIIGTLPSGGSPLSTVAIDDDSFHREISGWLARHEGERACPARSVWERLITPDGDDMQVKWLLLDCAFLQIINVLYRIDSDSFYRPVDSVAIWLRANWGLDLATVRATLELQLGSQLDAIVAQQVVTVSRASAGQVYELDTISIGEPPEEETIFIIEAEPDDTEGETEEESEWQEETEEPPPARDHVPGDYSSGIQPDHEDGDGDGVIADYCPNSPEDQDGFEDHDGCPDEDHRYPLTCDAVEILYPRLVFLCSEQVLNSIRGYFIRMAEQGKLAGISINPEVSRLLDALGGFSKFASVDEESVTVDIDGYVLHFYEMNNLGAVWQLYLGLGATMGPVYLFGGNTDTTSDDIVYPLVYSEKIGIKLNSFRSHDINIHHNLFFGGLLYSLTSSLAGDSDNALAHTAIVGLDLIGVRLWNAVELNLEATLFAPLSGDGTFGASGGINLALPLVDYIQNL